MTDHTLLRKKMEETVRRLRERSASRTLYTEEAESLMKWREARGISGLWPRPPLMAAATLDDGFGHGLEVIRLWAEAAGIRHKSLGLMLEADSIVSSCLAISPDILGLTILQFDSEEAVASIRQRISPSTLIIAGGPLFRADPDFAGRSGIDVVIKDAPAFLEFLLRFRTPGVLTPPFRPPS